MTVVRQKGLNSDYEETEENLERGKSGKYEGTLSQEDGNSGAHEDCG